MQKLNNNNLKLKRKGTKGITLIALVITIIVLLILAGVSIAMLTGQNGILTQAQNAKEQTEQSQEEELRRLTALEAATNVENTTYKDKNEQTVTIPAGFAVSKVEGENTIENGLVIIDSNGNEFVWIPVDDINKMAQCSTAGGSCNLEFQGDVLRCTTHNSEDIVGKLYAITNENKGENFGTVNTTYDANNGLREPAIVTDYDAQYYSNAGFSSLSAMETSLKAEYKKMAISVAKNKGFYVGRYELGLERMQPVSKNASTNAGVKTADGVHNNINMWYGLYSKCKEFAEDDSTKSVVSSMIWGSQYDEMMNWMQEQGENVTSPDSSKQNNSWVTGESSKDIIRNVYDLYACHREATLEANYTYSRTNRGGYSGGNLSPSNRFNPNLSDSDQWRWFISHNSIY